ncbi:MAG: hypothetical protein AAF950_00945 [Pseudomonadota bacterium]
MLWLIVQMSSLLGFAALFGTFVGWGIRGLLLKGRARRSIVERDIALTELDQARAELDGLYAAQKTGVVAAEEAGDATLKEELEAREEKVQSLTSALATSQQELVKLKERSASDLAAAAEAIKKEQAAAEAEPVNMAEDRFDAPIHQPSAELEWRNRYLESRVRTLESGMSSLVEAQAAKSEETAKPAEDAPEAPDVTPVPASNVVDVSEALPDEKAAIEAEKLAWMNQYLRSRASYLAAHPVADRAALYAEEIEPEPLEEPDLAEDEDEPSAAAAEDVSASTRAAGEVEQELARLRWRNRYLEGRLAYIEGDVERSEATAKADTSTGAALPRAISSGSGQAAIADAPMAPASTGKPPMLERPEDDGDDLTQIRGLSEDMKSALNEIGVWRFTQIASWSRENLAWVAENLSDEAMANHQEWIEQADVLAKGGGRA